MMNLRESSALDEVIKFANDRDNTDMGMRAEAELKELRGRLTLKTLENIKGASVLDDKNAEIKRLQRIAAAARDVLIRMPKKPEENENGEYPTTFLSVSAPIWEGLEKLAAALNEMEQS